MLRDARARTIESSGTTTCLPTISGAASIRMSLAALTSSASYPSLDAHASSKASAWNTLRSGCVRRAPRGPGDRGGVRKRPRRDRRGHLASLARIDTTPRTSRQSTRRDATARARSRLCARPRRRFRTRPGSEKRRETGASLGEKLCERWRSKLHAVLPSLLTMRTHDARHDAPETSM